jgi:hypothetical protein
VGHGVLHAQHRAQDVEGEHTHELVGILQVVWNQPTAATRVGDHAPEVPRRLHGSLDGAGDVRFLGHVGHRVVGREPGAGQVRHHGLEAGFGPAADHDDGTLGGETRRAGLADSRPAPGDQYP